MAIPRKINPLRTITGILLSALCLARPLMSAEPAAIDLNKPAGESLRPDGFYWTFDDGIVGTSDPKTIEDLSGNGITGTSVASKAVPMPTYAEGKFGNGIYLQGLGSIVTWSEQYRTDSPMGFLTTDGKGKPFTAGLWFKMDDTKPIGHILLRRDGGARKGWRIAIVKADSKDIETEGNSWKLRMEFGDYNGDPGSKAITEVFADGGWHHIGVSIAPDGSSENAGNDLSNFTAVYWLDGQLFDTILFSTKEVVIEQGCHSIVVGDTAYGIVDDAFITSGVHTFKK